MDALFRWRDRIVEGFGRWVELARSLRVEDLKQQVAALWAARGRLREPTGLLVIAAVVLLGGVIAWSMHAAASQAGERDFEFPVICAACSHQYGLSREAMLDLIDAARHKGHAAAGRDVAAPLGLCPKCGKLAVYRASACQKCNALMAPGGASVNGAPVVSKCPACGWAAERSGG